MFCQLSSASANFVINSVNLFNSILPIYVEMLLVRFAIVFVIAMVSVVTSLSIKLKEFITKMT